MIMLARDISKPARIPVIPVAKSFCFTRPFKSAYQFRITLLNTEPLVWRRIQVPDTYTFWDLHVAITDAMPWLDYHLHVFRVRNPKTKRKVLLGIPDNDGELDHKPCENYQILDFFTVKNPRAEYCYDFGDSWEHVIELEEIRPREAGVGYPRCIDGRNACPPDDVGGISGYHRFKEIIRNPKHEEYKEKMGWAELITGHCFDPNRFDPALVRFDDPTKRYMVAFEDHEVTPDMRGWDDIKRLG